MLYPATRSRSCSPACHRIAIGGMAGIKQNGILGRLLRDSWLVFAEYLV